MLARILVVALALAGAAAPASAQISANPKLLAPFKAIVASANESTVRVRGDDRDIALGTVVFSDGYILTKASEMKGALSVRLPDGTEYDAKVVATHVPTDLAMLKVDIKDLKPISFSDTKKVPVGHWLAAAGTHSDPLAVGIVSVATRKLTDFDAFINNANRGFLGVLPSDEKDEDGNVIGAKLDSVTPKGAADKAGLKKGDVVIEVNGKATLGQTELRAQLEQMRPGEAVKLKVLRGGEEKEFEAKLTGNPEPSRGDIQNSMGGELSGRRTGFPAVLQTDMVIDPKNCGGPVVDLDGKVLGVNIARAGRVETWILPTENIRPLLDDLKAGKSTAAPKR